MTAQRMTISHHFIRDREDRYLFIATEIGWGEVVLEVPSVQKPNCVQRLTDTGVVMIVDPKVNMLITAYVPQLDRVLAMYHSAGQTPSKKMLKIIKHNHKIER